MLQGDTLRQSIQIAGRQVTSSTVASIQGHDRVQVVLVEGICDRLERGDGGMGSGKVTPFGQRGLLREG